MKEAYYIFDIHGNYEQIKKLDCNPKSGFKTYEDAEKFLKTKHKQGLWEVTNSWFSNFVILKTYYNLSPNERKTKTQN